MRSDTIALMIPMFIAGCGRSAAPTADGRPLAADPVPVARHGRVSREDAVRLAADYLHSRHPEIVPADTPPTAEYFEKSAVDCNPLWVVGFAVPVPRDTGGVSPFLTQAVWVRGDGSVALGPASTP